MGDKMTDERIHIWNLLHDGEITAVSPAASESVTIFVSIPYLRRRLSPIGDSFVLSLSGVRFLEFHHFDGEVTSLPQALEVGGPEILATESESMPVSIETTLGQLKLEYESVSLALDTGQPIGYETIARVCEEYWTFSAWRDKDQGSDPEPSVGPQSDPPPINPTQLHAHLRRAKEGRKLCCEVCGTRWRMENLNLCRNCGSVMCGRCIEEPTGKRRSCDCGGQFD